MEAEKRKTERFVVRNGIFVAFGNDLPKVGMLKDISKGGLSFEYLYDEKPVGNDSRVDIYMTRGEFFLREVPCSKVYEITPATGYDDNQFSSTTMNRCGFKFGLLSADQSVKLSSFINTYAIQPAS